MITSGSNPTARRFHSARNQSNPNLADHPRDAIGRAVDSERAAAAVRCFAELWEHSLFDCDPQDYEAMTRDVLYIMAIPHA
jgi:hypothetical protein